MKTLLSGLLTLSAALPLAAQQIDSLRNSSFENWEIRPLGNEDPRYWYSLNELGQFGYPANTTKSTEAHSGTYSVKLETVSGPFSDIPGLLSTGSVLDANGDVNLDGMLIPYSGRPTHVRFWHKGLPASGDSLVFSLALTKWNGLNSRRDTVGRAVFSVTQQVANWTEVSLNVQYLSPDAPDSIAVIFSTSLNSFTPPAGAIWFIDDLELLPYATGMEVPATVQINAWPNPVGNELHLSAPQNIRSIRVYNITGQLISHTFPANQEAQLQAHCWAPGVYQAAVELENGEMHRVQFIK